MPTAAEEAADPVAANFTYDSAVKWLKERTRKEKFWLVERENAQYGFRRNLRGMRPLGIISSLITLVVAALAIEFTKPEFFHALSSGSISPVLSQFRLLEPSVIATTIVNLVAVLAWLLVVRDDWVKDAGYQYANALLASCDKISQSSR
jgi:hypothetical protein